MIDFTELFLRRIDGRIKSLQWDIDYFSNGSEDPILSNPVNVVELSDDGETEEVFKISEIYIKLTKRFNYYGATYSVAFVEPKTIMIPTLIYEEYETK